MSGVVCRKSVGAGAPIPPFAAQILLVGGSSFNVSGASGNIYAQGGAVISIVETGGVPPYSDSKNVVKEGGSGSLAIVSSGDGIHDTVGWSGMAVGDSVIFHLTLSASDSSGKSDSSQYPAVGQTILIHRVS